jgi:hypothetical protein
MNGRFSSGFILHPSDFILAVRRRPWSPAAFEPPALPTPIKTDGDIASNNVHTKVNYQACDEQLLRRATVDVERGWNHGGRNEIIQNRGPIVLLRQYPEPHNEHLNASGAEHRQ